MIFKRKIYNESLRQRQGRNVPCLLRHCLQHKGNMLGNSETDQKRGKYTQLWSVFAYITIFITRQSNILEKSSKISRLKNIRISSR